MVSSNFFAFCHFFAFFRILQFFSSLSDEGPAEGEQGNAERQRRRRRGDWRRAVLAVCAAVLLEVDVLVGAELLGKRGQGGLVGMVYLAEGRWKDDKEIEKMPAWSSHNLCLLLNQTFSVNLDPIATHPSRPRLRASPRRVPLRP